MVLKRYMLALMLFSPLLQASEEAEYMAFFKKYQALGNSFDVKVVELYADDAEVIALRKMPDGVEQTLKIKGERWKQIVADAMELGRQRDDRSEFSDIKIDVQKGQAKVTANRYATTKCFTDTQYYMVIEKVGSKGLKIVKEYMESPVESSCTTSTKNDVSLLLQATVKMANKQLPIMVDSDTRLEKTSSEGKTLIYHYVLVNYLSTEIDAEILEQNIGPMVKQQTCTMPNLKPVLDQGGSVSYRYTGNDDKPILSIVIDKKSCT